MSANHHTHSLVTLSDPRSPGAEAYRTLRTNLMFSSLDKPLHTLLVTAPSSDSNAAGKSETIANLAVTLAQGGRKTLLVDCDLRRPHQQDIWGLNNDVGLTSVLLEEGELLLQDVGVENLSVLPSGPQPANPADLIGSRRMEVLLERFKKEAEFVLFDAPPVITVTDATLLALKLDGVLLVLSAGNTRRDHATRAKELLEKVNINVIGAVLNNAPRDSSLGGY